MRVTLAVLLRRTAERLDALLRGILDRPLADHVHVAGARDGILVLAADTPVWGHRIRYLAPAILERMREQEPKLDDVRIIVRPPQESASPPDPSRRAHLTARAATLLRSVAESCDNEDLARVLARMGSRKR